jgi:type III pantothenate kinase
MLLAIDISNTSIKAGIFQNEKIIAHWRVATERHKLLDDYAVLFLSLLQAHKITLNEITGVVMSCVVPPLRAVFQQFAQQYLKLDPICINAKSKIGIKLAIDNPLEVGADRIGTAVALHKLYGGPAIAVTFGTATVFDCISAKGDYLGGAIAPGMIGALESLTRSAAQLYQVELIKPPKNIGTNTIHMLQSGLVLGYASMVDGLVQKLKKELSAKKDQSIKVIASGGLADIVAPETKVVNKVDQQLLLKGLRLIYEFNQ